MQFILPLFLFSAVSSAQTSTAVKVEFGEKTYIHDVYSATGKGKHPGVVLVPEFWGKDDLYKPQAEWLVGQGYTVLVMDLYGNGAHSTQAELATKMQSEAETPSRTGPKIDELLKLLSSSIATLKAQPGVDASKIAAIGFGYGGGLVTNLAEIGSVQGLKAVVSYYGGVRKLRPIVKGANSPAVLYIRPEYDSYTLPKSFDAFVGEMKRAQFDFDVLELKEAHYGFVHKQIESYGSDDGHTLMYYNATAAATARVRVGKFLKEKLK